MFCGPCFLCSVKLAAIRSDQISAQWKDLSAVRCGCRGMGRSVVTLVNQCQESAVSIQTALALPGQCSGGGGFCLGCGVGAHRRLAGSRSLNPVVCTSYLLACFLVRPGMV